MKARNDRVNEENIMNNGLKARIVAYRNADDIDVEFENGTVIKSSYACFKRGRIRFNEDAIDENGVQYRSVAEMCRIRHISTSRYFTMLRQGYSKKSIFTKLPKNKKGPYVGQESKMFCGMRCKIKAVYSVDDIDVEFQDGTVFNHITYKQYQQRKLRPKSAHDELAKRRIGEKFELNDGVIATITEYKSARDITISLSDGKTYYKQRYDDLKNGKKRERQEYLDMNIGDTRMMNCGVNATLVAFRDRNDIDVKFETGQIVEHRRFQDFIKGKIREPIEYDLRVGESRKMNCGMYATITKYLDSRDIDVIFEDGTSVKSKDYYTYIKGSIGHPNISTKGTGQLGTFNLIKTSVKYLDDVYYECKCQRCNYKGILTPQEILSHKCNVQMSTTHDLKVVGLCET